MKKHEGILLPLLVVSFILGLAVVACGGNPAPTATAVPAAPAPTAVPTKPVAAPTATAVPAAPAPTAVPTKPAAAPTATAVPATPTTSAPPPASGPPAIPHDLAGRAQCTLCHQVGAPGAGQPGGTGLAANHLGRTNDTCQLCHKPK